MPRQKIAGEPAARRSRVNGRRTRQRLLAAAIALWSEHGSLGVTVSSVAERAETARRTVYHHFPTQEALLSATIEFVDTELAYLTAGEIGPDDNPYRLVAGLAADNPDLIRSVLSRLLAGDPMTDPIYASGVQYWMGEPSQRLREGILPEHANAVSISMWYAANLIIATKQSQAERRREAERFARTYERVLHEGIFAGEPARYGGLEVSEARRLRQLEDENGRLKRLLAESVLDNAILKDLLGKV